MSQPYRRRKKLVAPRFQLRMAGAGIAIAVVSVMTLLIIFNQSLVQMMDRGWIDSAVAQDGWFGFLLGKLLLALAVLVPLTLALVVVLSHRIAGPVYRFHVFLGEIRDGKRPADCRIREGDEFQDLCALLNEVTAPLRQPLDAIETCDRVPAAEQDGAASAAERTTARLPT